MCSMSCFPCFGKRKKEKEEDNVFNDGQHPTPAIVETQHKNIELQAITETGNTQVQSFTFRELATATKNFTPDCLLGEGGLGRVYKGCLANGQTVAIKQLGRDSLQEINEFLVEVSNLSLLNHPNLVSLVGYCADGEQRLLVHEFIPNGSLENHLFDLKQDQKSLDWYTRMKIAYGAAQGLEYLHDKANPPIIYRELKSSNFLLDQELKPKLSDYGLGKLGTSGDKPLLSSSLMGTYGYCAPECSMGGEVTVKSDVYSFGVVLLELITGRRALDTSMPSSEQNLVSWAQPMFHDQKRYPELADPNLKHDYPASGLNQAVAIASMCLQDEPSVRPIAADVVTTLSFLIEPTPTSKPTPNPDVPTQPKPESEHSDSSYSDSESSDDEHVVETLQLGKRKQKQGSRTSSKSRSSNGSALNSNDRNNLSSLSSKCPIYDDYGSKKSSSGKLVCSSSKYYDDAYEFDENEGSSSSKNHEEKSLSVKHSKKGSKKIGSSSKHHDNYEGISENEREKHHEERSLSVKHSKKGSKKIGSSSKHHENYEGISENEREEHHEERSLSVKHSKKGSKKIGSSSKHHEINYEDTSENEKEKSLSMKKDSRSFKDGSDSPGSRHEDDDHESGSDDSGSRHSDEKSEGSTHEYESD